MSGRSENPFKRIIGEIPRRSVRRVRLFCLGTARRALDATDVSCMEQIGASEWVVTGAGLPLLPCRHAILVTV